MAGGTDATEGSGLPKWRRSPAAQPRAEAERRPRCGGPEWTAAEREEYLRQWALDRAAEREQAERERAEEAEREARQRRGSRPADEDEDDERAVERFRNDRYAVGLLRQDGDAWGGGDAGSGVLG
jgi:hypothetical protein